MGNKRRSKNTHCDWDLPSPFYLILVQDLYWPALELPSNITPNSKHGTSKKCNVHQFSVRRLRSVKLILRYIKIPENSAQASVILLKVSPEELSSRWVCGTEDVCIGIKVGIPIIIIIRWGSRVQQPNHDRCQCNPPIIENLDSRSSHQFVVTISHHQHPPSALRPDAGLTCLGDTSAPASCRLWSGRCRRHCSQRQEPEHLDSGHSWSDKVSKGNSQAVKSDTSETTSHLCHTSPFGL